MAVLYVLLTFLAEVMAFSAIPTSSEVIFFICSFLPLELLALKALFLVLRVRSLNP